MDVFNDNLITLYNGKNELELLIGEKIENYIVIDENYFKFLINNIYNNNLLILFSFTFFSTLYCCVMKDRKKYKDYIVVDDTQPISGTIVETNSYKV